MIGIIGVGSVGKNLLDTFVRKMPFEKFVVFDDDIVNKNNIQYQKKYIGKKKTLACADKYSNVLAITEYVDNDNLTTFVEKNLKNCDTIFDCRDTFEGRTSFDAIKIFINKDNLVVDFRKNIAFRSDVEGEYVSYISNQFIKSLLAYFVRLWINDQNKIKMFMEKGNAIAINQIGRIEELYPSASFITKDVGHLIESIDSLDSVSVNIIDGLYNLANKNFDLNQYSISQVADFVKIETSHFPAVYLVPSVTQGNLNLNVINQTGGA